MNYITTECISKDWRTKKSSICQYQTHKFAVVYFTSINFKTMEFIVVSLIIIKSITMKCITTYNITFHFGIM